MKKIAEKISKIRLEPEHVRMRYVWGCVIASMLLIFALWIFSINVMFQKQKATRSVEQGNTSNLSEQLQELKKQTTSLKDYTQQPLSIDQKNTDSVQSISDFNYPAASSEIETPQTDAYSGLSEEGILGQ